jgi:tRNA A37 threonylcarbamoyladenosine synthetase subunit TsaC/SUA5/YrdC
VPDRELTRALCRLAGPLISTSANRAGGAPPLTCDEAVAAVGPSVAWAIDAGPGNPVPSTIVDATGHEPRLLRAGAIPWDQVSGLWSAME